jgi:ABC-type branched-subunit amino acid transport system ATPase component
MAQLGVSRTFQSTALFVMLLWDGLIVGHRLRTLRAAGRAAQLGKAAKEPERNPAPRLT